jgi:hypothetical protein
MAFLIIAGLLMAAPAIAQETPIQLQEQACPSTEAQSHPCWIITSLADRVTIWDVISTSGSCQAGSVLPLPVELHRGDTLNILSAMCDLEDIMITTDQGAWAFGSDVGI